MKNKVYNTAMYLRLSRDDNDIGDVIRDGNVKSESNSISSQRDMIRAYIREHDDMELYDVYIDDGFSGVDFERPEFKRMMEDVEAGKVNCIIVKDLSRFGRDYIEAGRFIQKTFPALSVRFIALTDNYDSLHTDGSESAIVLPVKNFINDSYCRDISMKVKSGQQVKRKNGDFIGAFAVYGYVKDPQNKNKLIIDDYAAIVVKQIFAWKMEGLAVAAIAHKLNELGYLSPMQYKKTNGEKFNTGFTGKNIAKWSAVSVKRILTNEIYLGHMIQGKREKINYKVRKQIDKPEEEWVKVENTHEAIILEDDFNVVQKLLSADVRMMNHKQEVSLFSGILFCGDCRQQMVRRVNNYKGTTNVYYICSTKNRGEGCTRHSISEEKLKNIVFTVVKKFANAFLNQQQLFEYTKNLETNFETISKYDKEIKRIQEEQGKYYKLCSGLYGDLKNGVITRRDFDKLHLTYTKKSEELETALKKQEELIKKLFRAGIASGARLENFKKCIELNEIDRHTLASLVNRIQIFENHFVEVEFNFMNEYLIIENLNQIIQQEEKERRGA